MKNPQFTWLRAADRALRFIVIAFALLVYSATARAANYTDIWWNANESGWGMALTHHHDKIFGLLYIYDVDGKPLWVTMPDGRFENNGRRYVGELFRTRGPSYNAATYNPGSVVVTSAGTATIDFSADEQSATIQLTVSGHTWTKEVRRFPFGNAPSNYPFDRSDMYWNPSESGWGITLNQNGDNIFGVLYVYDETGRPMWLAMPGGGFIAQNRFRGALYLTTGSPYTTNFNALDSTVKEAGVAEILFDSLGATLTTTINGYTRVRQIRRYAFGTNPYPGLVAPKVTLAVAGTVNPVVAPATVALKAEPTVGSRPIAKVEFYADSVRVAELTAAPWEFTVKNVGSGLRSYSARVTDDRQYSAMATSALDVKPTATMSNPAPPTSGNKLPKVKIATPINHSQLMLGVPVPLTAEASDHDGVVSKVEYFSGTVRLGEAFSPPWRLDWSGFGAGNHIVHAIATDERGGQTTSATVAIAIVGPAAPVEPSTRDATRLLTQATFGIKDINEIAAVRAMGPEAWLNQQFAMSANSHVQYVNDRKAAGEKAHEERAYEAIWQQWLWEPAQLRARMSFALSEIFVISNIAPDLDTYAMASYMDMLNRNAFGNYRQLLEQVALHPAMGYYLNMIGSRKADPVKGTHPNENFAREVMQLFSIGLYKLNTDGSRVLDGAGKPVNTYDEAVIKSMAAAFTGWNFAGNDNTKPSTFNPPNENWIDPMIPWESMHDTNPKTIFDGIQIPGGQTAAQDMKAVLDALYHHPNVGPFIGRQLIQRFVTSNPSPQYIARVAGTFNNNGAGVRGDLRATLRAVLLDPEARSLAKTTEAGWGKQREPVIRFATFLRTLGATSPSGRNRIWYLDSADEGLNQSPLLSPSVFNFFSPNYRQPGALAAANLVAPEFQITTETSMVGTLNFFARLIKNGSYGYDDTKLTMNFQELNTFSVNAGVLADRLNLLFMNGAMTPGLRQAIVDTVGAMPMPKTGGDSSYTVNDRVKAALILVSLSPDFVIQK